MLQYNKFNSFNKNKDLKLNLYKTFQKLINCNINIYKGITQKKILPLHYLMH